MNISLRGKNYELQNLGVFVIADLVPLIMVFSDANKKKTTADYKDLIEILEQILPDLPSDLINKDISRGVLLSPQELLTIYKQSVKYLQELGQLEGFDIDSYFNENDQDSKALLIKEYQQKIKELEKE